jgi:ELWxxDGT repeat protein
MGQQCTRVRIETLEQRRLLSTLTISPEPSLSVREGGALDLVAPKVVSANGGDPTFEWDLNGDGDHRDAISTNRTMTVPWSQLTTLGINDGPAVYGAKFRVKIGTVIATMAVGTLNILDTPPSLKIAVPDQILAGTYCPIGVRFADPGKDTVSHFTVDWGDGTSTTINGYHATIKHRFKTAGKFKVSAKVTNEDGTFTTSATSIRAVSKLTGAVELGGGGIIHSIQEINGRIIFADDTGLCASDGTSYGKTVLYPGSTSPLTVNGNVGYFTVESGDGDELWRTDGTIAGTQKFDVDDLSYFPPFVFKRKLYFSTYASDEDRRFVLNVVVGDTTTTRQVSAPAAIYPMLGYPGEVFGGTLFFVGDPADGSTGSSLYRFDGRRVSEVLKLTGMDGHAELRIAGGAMFVVHYDESADPAKADAVWRSDGTVDGTVLIDSGKLSFVYPGVAGLIGFVDEVGSDVEVFNIPAIGEITLISRHPNPDDYRSPYTVGTIGKNVVFLVQDPDQRQELWRTDGTAAGTQRIFTSPTGSKGIGSLVNVGDEACFVSPNSKGGSSLFVTDGTETGTIQLTPTVSGGIQGIQLLDGAVVFTLKANSKSSPRLYRTDGTVAGTRLVSGLTALQPTAEVWLLAVENHLYAWASRSDQMSRRLWRLYIDDIT